MIFYDDLPLDKEILAALSELKISYAFQPIFYPDGKTIYAREALMRPEGKSVMELIEEYEKKDKLHVIEIATLFGAIQEYLLRGYTEYISINSFPSECMKDTEAEAFKDYYGNELWGKMIIEMLEYPKLSISNWVTKCDSIRRVGNFISLDDYGSGINDMSKVDFLKPDIVKMDRSLISEIDKDTEKQYLCKENLDNLHSKGKLVVAEGVETKEEFDYLVSIGVDLFQGYYLAKPN